MEQIYDHAKNTYNWARALFHKASNITKIATKCCHRKGCYDYICFAKP